MCSVMVRKNYDMIRVKQETETQRCVFTRVMPAVISVMCIIEIAVVFFSHRFNVPYPNMYALESENPDARAFNCVQVRSTWHDEQRLTQLPDLGFHSI